MAGSAEQSATIQVEAMAGETGAFCFCGHCGHPPASAIKLLKAAVSCGICTGIDMAAVTKIDATSPTPNATSGIRTRR